MISNHRAYLGVCQDARQRELELLQDQLLEFVYFTALRLYGFIHYTQSSSYEYPLPQPEGGRREYSYQLACPLPPLRYKVELEHEPRERARAVSPVCVCGFDLSFFSLREFYFLGVGQSRPCI